MLKFFYNLDRVENYEYVVIKILDGDFSGHGAILPIRKKGENYKTIMGVIEEYRTIVEHSCTEDTFIISSVLNNHFPNHPKVVFAIQSAYFELYSKKYNIPLKKLLGNPFPKKVEIDEPVGRVIIPEEIGDLMAVKSLPYLEKDDFTFMFIHYPKNEMFEVISVLSSNYKYVGGITWSELL